MQPIYLLTTDGYKDISLGIDKEAPCKEILTELGNIFIADRNLKIQILTDKGDISFKNIEDLSTGDIIISRIDTQCFSEDKTIDLKLSYLLGLLYALKISPERYTFVIPRGSITDYISEYFYRYFNVSLVSGEYNIVVPEDFINKYNINVFSIPLSIFEGTKDVEKSFLQGFFDINTVIADKMFLKDFYKEHLLQQIGLMLKNFGIVPEVDNSSLIISGEEIINYYNVIGTYNDAFEEELLCMNLDESDFYQIFNIEGICRAFYETTDKSINFDLMLLNRKNIEKLIELDGDENLKEKIKILISDEYCFEKVLVANNIHSKSLDIGEDGEYVINSFVIKR